jgi:hypothetical protein
MIQILKNLIFTITECSTHVFLVLIYGSYFINIGGVKVDLRILI